MYGFVISPDGVLEEPNTLGGPGKAPVGPIIPVLPVEPVSPL